MAASVNDFTFDWYRQAASTNGGNIFVSPYSMAGALVMVAEGARGTTLEQIGQVLHFPQSARNADEAERPWRTRELLQAFGSLNSSLAPLGEAVASPLRVELKELEGDFAELKGEESSWYRDLDKVDLAIRINNLRAQLDKYEFRVANAVWVDAGMHLRPEYLSAVSGYGALTKGVDFRRSPEGARTEINAWASRQTNGRIPSVLDAGSVNDRMRLVLTNAVYFKGEWQSPFDLNRTREQGFTDARGEVSPCMMMSDLRTDRYAEIRPDGTLNALEKVAPGPTSRFSYEWKWADNPDGWKILELPYKGDRLSFVAILPNDPAALDDLEAKLESQTLQAWLNATVAQRVDVHLPRIHLDYAYERAVADLEALGMSSAFAPGGLTGFSDDPEAVNLFVSDIVQKTFIDVDEKGTEAAAVTAVFVASEAAAPIDPPKPLPEFRANHPFLYLIRDTTTGAILFIGRLSTSTG